MTYEQPRMDVYEIEPDIITSSVGDGGSEDIFDDLIENV